jgi:hypothetical protein
LVAARLQKVVDRANLASDHKYLRILTCARNWRLVFNAR